MFFDSKAKMFDNDRRKQRAKIISNNIKLLLKDSYMSAMEFGCGTGLVGLELLSEFKNITFIDSSIGMIDEVSKKLVGVKNAKAVHKNLLNETLDEKFDCIFTSMVLHHIIDTEKILNVLINLLNKNGLIIIVDLDKDDGWFHSMEPDFEGHNGFEHFEIIDSLGNVGFKDIGIETFFKGEKNVNGKNIPYSLFICKAEND